MGDVLMGKLVLYVALSTHRVLFPRRGYDRYLGYFIHEERVLAISPVESRTRGVILSLWSEKVHGQQRKCGN